MSDDRSEIKSIGSNLASIRVAGVDQPVYIPVTSKDKPEVSEDVISHWQNILDLTAKIINVPASLIMKAGVNEIEVFLKSDSKENPYEEHEKAPLQIGLYCETVMGTRKPLLVPNALNDELWKNNPDIELNMISYYGLPVIWPDGELFGTYCVLDNKENNYNDDYFELLRLFKSSIENDLKILSYNDELKKSKGETELRLSELRHRVKNNFNIIISLIRLEKFQREAGKQKSIESIMDEIESKIRAISLIHEKLSAKGDLNTVSLSQYIEDLINPVLDGSDMKIELNNTIPETELNSDQLITVGLIFNELVTNSLKHAFKNTDHPIITVTAEKSDHGLRISYSDNGMGIPSTFFEESDYHLGGTILTGLADQLGDGIELLPSGQGFSFTIKD